MTITEIPSKSCSNQIIACIAFVVPVWAGLLGCDRPLTSIELLERGIMLAQRDQFPEAIDNFNRSINLQPDNPDPYYERAVAYEQLDQQDQAFKDYSEAIRLYPEFVQAFVNRGRLFVQRQDYEQALQDFSSAINVEPRFAQAFEERGAIYRELNQVDNAIADLNRSLELEATAIRRYLRGNLLTIKNQFQEAADDFDKAIELDQKLAKAWLGRAIVRCKLGNKVQGRADLLHAAQIDTEIISDDILFVLGELNEPARAQGNDQHVVRKSIIDHESTFVQSDHEDVAY